MVLGILSLICFWLITAIPAVICGHIAYSRINRSPGTLCGRGFAVAGLITGYTSIALTFVVVPMLISIAVPNFVKARHEALKHACVAHLLMIDGAGHQWALEGKEATEEPTEADLLTYLPNGFPACPQAGAYHLRSVEEGPSCSIPGHELPKENR